MLSIAQAQNLLAQLMREHDVLISSPPSEETKQRVWDIRRWVIDLGTQIQTALMETPMPQSQWTEWYAARIETDEDKAAADSGEAVPGMQDDEGV